jgi:ATP-binding protein involved in chromosome partitioning
VAVRTLKYLRAVACGLKVSKESNDMTDPRIGIIEERMKAIDNVVAVSSGKGGVGKSIIASVLALTLARKGFKVGLFDLDFTSPSTHIILGMKGVKPREERGIVPPQILGLQYMSIVYYSGDRSTPLRGPDISNALIELLSVTKWEKADYLILDMPPGIGDATLDLIRLINKIRFLIVTTPSKLAFETVKKLWALLATANIPVLGVVENMKMNGSASVSRQIQKIGLRYLTGIPYDPKLDRAIGDADKLMKTKLASEVRKIASEI